MRSFTSRRPSLARIAMALSPLFVAACGSSPPPPASSADSTAEASTASADTTGTEAPPEKSADASSASGSTAGADADMRKTIDTFLNDPASVDPKVIVDFVRDSPKVMVVYRSVFAPIDDGPTELRSLSLVAFAAGNAGAQLEAGKKQDMPAAGVRGMVAVYRKVKAANASVRSAKLDDFAARLDKGTLDAHVAELVAKAEADEAKAKK